MSITCRARRAAARIAAIAFLAAAAALAPDVRAQSTQSDAPLRQLEDVQRDLEARREAADALERQGSALEAELRELRETIATNALLLQARTQERDAILDRLGDLETELSLVSAQLQTGEQDLALTLAALQRASRLPPEALFLQPGGPHDVMRTAIALRAAVPAMAQRLEPLQEQLHSFQTLQSEVETRRVELVRVSRVLEQQEEELRLLLERRRERLNAVRADADATRGEIDALAAQAANLRQFVLQLRPLEVPEAVRPSVLGRTGNLILPVAGDVTGRYGERLLSGARREGITIEGDAGAFVLAPQDGVVRYAGPFQRLGQIVIIDHGGAVHTVMAGALDISVVPNQPVRAGEPVATLAGTDPETGASVGTPSTTPQNRLDLNQNIASVDLYLEVRHRGQPVDPRPLITALSTRD